MRKWKKEKDRKEETQQDNVDNKTNSMEQTPPREAYSRTASQNIPRLLW
jgi:hypothetical protein